ncbi:tetratricopeptide repeat protein [Streptomyces sp. KR80]|uniref:tetratricopeptide repeat protein n=1 Tax=Streptomyces sp. KR80 TaxID=3457426 RepID=UPI003FD6679A
MSYGPTTDESLGAFLRHLRTSAGLTQEELADRSGLSVRGIGNLENGRTGRPYSRSLRLLADALGLDGSVREELLRAARNHRPPNSEAASVPTNGEVAEGEGVEVAPVPPPCPAQLTADTADFSGRAELVTHLRNLLSADDGAVPIAALAGAGGLGKTALAVHVAHQLVENYPDGQLYVNLRGGSSEPLEPVDVLLRFLHDLGFDQYALRGGEAELSAMYRTALHGRRLLVVLDDAADSAQVRPLLPGGSGCAVLITTRGRLADLEGSRLINLDVLRHDEGRALLARIAGPERIAAEPLATERLLDACGGLPLAIRITAARLASRPTWSVARMADRLADERYRLDELKLGDLQVRASFEVSYRAIAVRDNPETLGPSRAFRLLGTWQGADISEAAAAALFGTSKRTAAAVLDELVDANLLESTADGRYRFHDLLRLYADERAREEELPKDRLQALRRLLTWYLHTGVEAIAMMEPARRKPTMDSSKLLELGIEKETFADHDAALRWCEAELTNAVTATRQAAAEGLNEVAWRLPAVLWRFYLRRSHWPEWIATHRTALDSARRLGNRSAEGWLLNYLGNAYLQQHEFDEARRCLQQSVVIVRETGEPHAEARALTNLGMTSLCLGRLDESAEQYRAAIAIGREIGDRYAESHALSRLGEVFGRMARIDEAIDLLEQSLRMRREIGDLCGQADSLDLLGEVLSCTGRLGAALERLDQAVAFRRATGDRYGEALSLGKLAQVHAELGCSGEATELYCRAIDIQRAIGHRAGEKLTLEMMNASVTHLVHKNGHVVRS